MVLTKVSKIISNLSKGVVTDYALYILIGVCFYLSLFTFLSVFFDLIYSVTTACIFILILIGSQYYYNSIDLSDENKISSLEMTPVLKRIILFSISILPLIFIICIVSSNILLLGLIPIYIKSVDLSEILTGNESYMKNAIELSLVNSTDTISGQDQSIVSLNMVGSEGDDSSSSGSDTETEETVRNKEKESKGKEVDTDTQDKKSELPTAQSIIDEVEMRWKNSMQDHESY